MKKFTNVLLSAVLGLSLAACGTSTSAGEPAAENNSTEPAAETQTADAEAKVYNVGIVQLVQHVALDAAAQGFQDELVAQL